MHSFIHHTSLYNIERRANTSGCESGQEGTNKVKIDVISKSSILQEHLLILIITGNFCSVDHRVSHDVGDESYPKTLNTISGNDLSVTINSAVVSHSFGVG
jgi:hypothetical protein